MNQQKTLVAVMLGLGLVLTACGPLPANPGQGAPSDRQAARGPTSLVVALDGEPKLLGTTMTLGNESNRWGDVTWVLHQRLSRYNDRSELEPRLATEVPTQARGSWTVRPDGTMQTRYRLRSDVGWHDGQPLTARDFVFAHTVTIDRDLPISNRAISSQIDRIETPDDHTLVIEWKQTYPFANAIVEDDLGPLPVHLLKETFDADKDRFQTLPYWRTAFIGVGPYRLQTWEPGSHMVLKSYEAFALGRAKIDTLTIRFIDDPNTAVTNLLSGAVDATLPGTIEFNQSMLVKEEWERAGKQPLVIAQTTHLRTLAVQGRAQLANPREVLDVRARRGLVHGIDRQSIVDALFQGQAPVAHTYLAPSNPRYQWIKDAVTTYDYDPRRADQGLAEVGWRRSGESPRVNAAGERVGIPIWTFPGSEQPVAIVADNWRQLGINVEEHVLPAGDARNPAVVCCFPAVQFTSYPNAFNFNFGRVHGRSCPTEANRWVGWNRGCSQNAELDPLIDSVLIAIDEGEQQRLYRETARMMSGQLLELPLFFQIQMSMFRPGVVGPTLNTEIRAPTWNVSDWELRD